MPGLNRASMITCHIRWVDGWGTHTTLGCDCKIMTAKQITKRKAEDTESQDVKKNKT